MAGTEHPSSVVRTTSPAPALSAKAGLGGLPFLLLAYLAFTALALLALHIPGVGVAGQEFGFRRALFTAVNATTLTGFQQDVGSSRVGADVLRIVLTLGGTLFSLTLGGMAVVRVARLRYTDGQVAGAACSVTLVATLGGAAALFSPDRSLVSAVLLAASAFGNSGLHSGRLPGVLEWETHLVLLPLAFAGALGLPVLIELFDRVSGGRRLSKHSRTVLMLAGAGYLVGFGLLVVTQGFRTEPNVQVGDWRHTLALASAFAVDSCTAGLPFESAGAFSRPAQWILIALMIVGGNPGGTAGGVKTTAVYHLAGAVRASLGGRRLPRACGIAGVWVATYVLLVAVGFMFLLASEPDTSADRLLFLSASAAGNVGLSHDPVSITGHGLFTLSALMLAGRVLPWLVLWWMASTPDDGEAVAVG